jgi:hypothetical protein
VEIGQELDVHEHYSGAELEPPDVLPPDWLGHGGNGIDGDGTCHLD